MQLKSLFNDYLSYTEEGNEFSKEVSKLLVPLIKEWLDLGFSPRDMQNIITSVATLEVASVIIRRACEMKKEERKNEI